MALGISNQAGGGSLWMHELFPTGQLDLLSIRSNLCRPMKDDIDRTFRNFCDLRTL